MLKKKCSAKPLNIMKKYPRKWEKRSMNCMVLEKNDEIWEDYDISEADQAELEEKLKEIKEDISEDDKIADDVEKMIQQQVNNFRASMLSMTKDWRAWHRNFYNSSELIVPATDI